MLVTKDSKLAAKYLRQGRAVVFPTETCYGLAVDAFNVAAVKKLYRLKGREFNKPVHVLVSSLTMAKAIVQWNSRAQQLAKKFWPGPLTLVLPLRSRRQSLQKLSATRAALGVRVSSSPMAGKLVRTLGRPITATSANISGQPDCYSVTDVVKQFRNRKYQPDLILDAGRLPGRRPSTLVKISATGQEVLRQGPIKV